jgi:hypothetical protein
MLMMLGSVLNMVTRQYALCDSHLSVLGLQVNVSVNAPIEGYKRNSSRVAAPHEKKKGRTEVPYGVHYIRLPGEPEEEDTTLGDRGAEEGKIKDENDNVVIGV